MSLNRVTLIGHLGGDPEVKTLKSGNSVCHFSMATNEYYTDKKGQKKENTEWHKIVAWNLLAEFAEDSLKKGALVFIDGKLKTRTYQKEGQTHYITEIEAQDIQLLKVPN